MRLQLLLSTGLACLATAATTGSSTKLTTSNWPYPLVADYMVLTFASDAQDLFDYSMAISDARFDETYKFVQYPDNGPWSVRFTAWYVPGLLYRNKGKDLENAIGAIKSM